MPCFLSRIFLFYAVCSFPLSHTFRLSERQSLTLRGKTLNNIGRKGDWGCAKAVRGGIQRNLGLHRWKACKCPHGQVLVGNNSMCRTDHRFYRASVLEGKGCSCVSSFAIGDAAGDLHESLDPLTQGQNDSYGCSSAVFGATPREYASFYRYSCKCPRYFVVDGGDKQCQGKKRYFRAKDVTGKNCSCKNGALSGRQGHVLQEAMHKYSYVGQAVIQYLLDLHLKGFGHTWDMIDDLTLPSDWIVQTPPGNLLVKPLEDLHFVDNYATPENEGAKDGSTENDNAYGGYDADFGLFRCSNDTQCPSGFCRALDSTVRKPGDEPSKMCIGSADPIVDTYYNEIISAREVIDIVSLSSPDWVGDANSFNRYYTRFLAAIRNAITYLSNLNVRVYIRVLFGNILVPSYNLETVLQELTRDIPAESKLQVFVSAYNVFDSWAHSKIIAVDGHRLLQGGMNLWTKDYLTKPPVYDLSMKATGRVALSAHSHADDLWKHVCKKNLEIRSFIGGNESRKILRKIKDYLKAWPCSTQTRVEALMDLALDRWAAARNKIKKMHRRFTARTLNITIDTTSPQESLGKNAIPIARLGSLGANPSDGAFQLMFMNAKSSIKISQQDIGPPASLYGEAVYGWLYTTALCNAMGRGVDVYMILSSPGGNEYNNGWTADSVRAKFKEHSSHCKAAVEHHLGITYLMGEKTWPDGSTFMNHAKFFAIDDQVHYIGSQNLYNSDLAEFGLIIDDAEATSDILKQYWNPVWAQSAPHWASSSESLGVPR